MTNIFTNYLKKLALFTGFLVLLYVAALNLFPNLVGASKSVAIFVVLYVVTAGGQFLRLRAPNDKQKMIVLTLSSIVLKLLLYGSFAVVLILSDRPQAITNITLFFALYLCFTVFDIYQQRSAREARKTS